MAISDLPLTRRRKMLSFIPKTSGEIRCYQVYNTSYSLPGITFDCRWMFDADLSRSETMRFGFYEPPSWISDLQFYWTMLASRDMHHVYQI